MQENIHCTVSGKQVIFTGVKYFFNVQIQVFMMTPLSCVILSLLGPFYNMSFGLELPILEVK